MNRRKVFEKYMARYLLVIGLVLLCAIPFGVMAYRYIREYTISKTITRVERQVQNLDSQIEKMHLIATMMGEDEHLLGLASVRGEIPSERYLYMNYVRKRLFEIENIYDFASTSFVIFRHNPAFVSQSQVDKDWYDYYGSFLSAEGYDAEAFLQLLREPWEDSPYRVVNGIRYYDSQMENELEQAVIYKEVLTAGGSSFSGNSVIVFLIDREKMIDMLLDGEDREHTLLLITDRAGQAVVTSGEAIAQAADLGGTKEGKARIDGRDYWVIRCKGDDSGLTVTVGYPMETIADQLQAILRLLLLYVLLGCAGAVVITIMFTWHWFKPMRKVLDEVENLEDIHVEKENEYDYIRESILKLVSAKDEAELKILLADAENQAIMLENVFIRGFSSREKLEEFKRSFSWPEGDYYVVFFRLEQHKPAEDTDTAEAGESHAQPRQILLRTMELFQNQYGSTLIQLHLEHEQMTAIVPATGLTDGELQSMLQGVCEKVCEEYPACLIIGISRRQEELDEINVAFAQARQTVRAYKNKGKSRVEFYQMLYEAGKNCFHMDELRKLYDLTLCTDRAGINSIFEKMKQENLSSPEQYEFQKLEIYYTILFILHSVCQQMSIPMEENQRTVVELQKTDFSEGLEIMQQEVLKVCNLIDGKKASHNEKRRTQILEYLGANFNRPELNADLVSRELGLSEKYVYSFLKEQTGKTFSSYLEDLRMDYAVKGLKHTDWSNEKIAQESGFGSVNTFYRVFKKRTGVSPSAYRKQEE